MTLPKVGRAIRCAGAAAVLAGDAASAVAQTLDAAPWRAEFQSCVSNAEPEALSACEGRASDRCMNEIEGGHSTLGMVECLGMEAALWDEVLNDEWGPLMALMRAWDAEEREVFGHRFSNRADALLEAQRAWIAFRDAECGLDYASWGSGSMRSIAHASCQLSMTAERVARLRGLRGDGT